MPGGVQDQDGWGFKQPGLVGSSLPMAGRLEQDDFKVLSNTNHAMIL